MVKVKEHQVQAAIVDALVAAGFRVKHTSAFRQKGPSGVSKGIPDLLVSHPGIPCRYFGLEVKTPTGKLSAEQSEAAKRGEYVIVRDPALALTCAVEWLETDRHSMHWDQRFVDQAKRVLRSLGGDL